MSLIDHQITLVDNSMLPNNINDDDNCYLLSTHVWVRNPVKCFKCLSYSTLTTSSWRWANLISILHRETLRLKSLESGGQGFGLFHQWFYDHTVQTERREEGQHRLRDRVDVGSNPSSLRYDLHYLSTQLTSLSTKMMEKILYLVLVLFFYWNTCKNLN